MLHRLNSSENRLHAQLRAYMRQDLVNKIIEWKRANPDHDTNYQRFLYEFFPENIKTERKTSTAERKLARRQSSFSCQYVTWIDHRVDNNEWKEMFAGVSPCNEIQELGLPPGLELDDLEDESFDGQLSLEQQLEAASVGELSVWDKTKLAWQLGVAEVGSMRVGGLTGRIHLGDFTGLVAQLSPINSISNSNSPSNSDSDDTCVGSDSDDGDIAESQLRAAVVDFYKKHNPDKLCNVEKIVRRYAGKEQQLLKELQKKYGDCVLKEGWFDHAPTVTQARHTP